MASQVSEVQLPKGRLYRSRKNRPCDFCRKRRMACLKEENFDKCIGCHLRNLDCTYAMAPIKKRQSRKSSDASPPAYKDIVLEVQSANPCVFKVESRPHSISHERNALELHNGKRSLFVGFSGDQDPWLLKNIVQQIPEDNSDTNYALKNSDGGPQAPIFFAVYPTEYLDPRPGYYCVDSVQEVAKPLEKSIISTFFSVVNCAYPLVNECKFYEEMNMNTVSATLLATMYVISHPYVEGQEKSIAIEKKAAGDWFKLADFTSKALPLEQGAPTLQTIQSILLKLNQKPLVIRNANSPCHWSQSASLVASSQELGLHLDPLEWDIPLPEKRIRRRLWWAVYVQDKWESFGLSRPSHIQDHDFSVSDISVSDLFENEDEALENINVIGIHIFVAMVRLTKVLSELLFSFFSVKSFLHRPQSPEEALATGIGFMNRINAVESVYFPQSCPERLLGAMVSLHVAKAALALSCCRSVLYIDANACYHSLSERAFDYVKEFNSYLSSLDMKNLDTFWWSYSRVNFSIVGSCLLAFYVIGTTNGEGETWEEQVEIYHSNLKTITKHTHVTELALLRFGLLYMKIKQTSAQKMQPVHNSSVPEVQKIHPLLTDDDIFAEWLSTNGLKVSRDN
ncbi:hypothetical protein KL930_003403 [Ogataea haglerorum]|nr:hypothetical protein KL930_003403 [Ogataea haglerorum]KAG7777988.1 hypothetical protein KL922_002174 [Ogataea haglerorum]KAG7808509.1 hypothetical protein KL924_003555 [Ogataea haglerorum]